MIAGTKSKQFTDEGHHKGHQIEGQFEGHSDEAKDIKQMNGGDHVSLWLERLSLIGLK